MAALTTDANGRTYRVTTCATFSRLPTRGSLDSVAALQSVPQPFPKQFSRIFAKDHLMELRGDGLTDNRRVGRHRSQRQVAAVDEPVGPLGVPECQPDAIDHVPPAVSPVLIREVGLFAD